MIVLIPTLSETPLMLPQAESPLWSIFLIYIILSASYVNAQPVLPKTYIPPFGINAGIKVTVIDDDWQSTLTAKKSINQSINQSK